MNISSKLPLFSFLLSINFLQSGRCSTFRVTLFQLSLSRFFLSLQCIHLLMQNLFTEGSLCAESPALTLGLQSEEVRASLVTDLLMDHRRDVLCYNISIVKILFSLKIGKMGSILRLLLANNIIFDSSFKLSQSWALRSKRMMPYSQDHLTYLANAKQL